MVGVEFIVEIGPEEVPVRGNVVASGDVDYDREMENEVLADLEAGNDWAWCMVKVTAMVDGIEGSDYLGC